MAKNYGSAFAEREYQVCLVSRMVDDGCTYWVGAGGGPMYSILMAKRLYAPNAVYVTEDGIVAPEPALPFDPVMTVVSTGCAYRALQWTTMNGIGDQASAGYMDYGILNTLQIDPYGNINSTWVGTYPSEGRRINGPGGADTITAQCRRVIIMTDHERRKFVPKVDFISSAGYLDGTPGARERAGLPRDTGPWRVVTSWAVFDFQERYMRLMAIAPFVTVEQVLAEMSFKPLIAEDIEVLKPPTEEELQVLRTEMDVRGQFMDVSRWVVQQDGQWVIQEREAPPAEVPRSW